MRVSPDVVAYLPGLVGVGDDKPEGFFGRDDSSVGVVGDPHRVVESVLLAQPCDLVGAALLRADENAEAAGEFVEVGGGGDGGREAHVHTFVVGG